MSSNSGGLVTWVDCTKLGKVSSKELNTYADIIASTIRIKPLMSVAFVAAPILVSEKISNNLRDEMRRFEDKFDAKGLANFMVTLRMELPPSTKKVPIIFHGWLIMDQATSQENIFIGSQLVSDRLMAENIQCSIGLVRFGSI